MATPHQHAAHPHPAHPHAAPRRSGPHISLGVVVAGAVLLVLALWLALRVLGAGSDVSTAHDQQAAHQNAVKALNALHALTKDPGKVAAAEEAALTPITSAATAAQDALTSAGEPARRQALAGDTTTTVNLVRKSIQARGTLQAAEKPGAKAPTQAEQAAAQQTIEQANDQAKNYDGTVTALITRENHAAVDAGKLADTASSKRTWALLLLVAVLVLAGVLAAAWFAGVFSGPRSPLTPKDAVRPPAPQPLRQPIAPSADGFHGAAEPPGEFFDQNEPWVPSSPSPAVPAASGPVVSSLSAHQPRVAGALTVPRTAGGPRAKLAATTSAHSGTTLDAAEHAGMVIYAGSMIGPEHRAGKNFVPREDSYGWAPAHDPNVIVTAVADGVGSARNSHAAALIATETAVELLRGVSSQQVSAWFERPELWREQAQRLMVTVAQRLEPAEVDARAGQIELATGSSASGQRAADPATTLVVALGAVTGDGVRVLWASVGDSQVCVLAPGARQLSWSQSEGDAPGGTRALPRHADDVISSQYLLPHGHAFVLTTDGCEKVLSLDPGTVPLLHDMIARPGDLGSLLQLLQSNPPGAGDDRTLVLFAPTGGLR